MAAAAASDSSRVGAKRAASPRDSVTDGASARGAPASKKLRAESCEQGAANDESSAGTLFDEEARSVLAPAAFTVPEVPPSIGTAEFCSKYVSARRPVVLSGLLDDASFKAGERWTLDYLASKAGDVGVKVETVSGGRASSAQESTEDYSRVVPPVAAVQASGGGGGSGSASEASSSSAVSPPSHAKVAQGGGQVDETSARRSFGHGVEVEVPFNQVLSGLQKLSGGLKETSKISGEPALGVYMSTQSIPIDEEGRPALFGQLVEALRKDIPIRPRLAAGLLPANINIWMGGSTYPTCSGLHHDYHDNIYCLLKGRKRILLIPPGYAQILKPVGKIVKIHGNGRICYDSTPMTHSDGSTEESRKAQSAAIRVRQCQVAVEKLEAEIAIAEEDSADQEKLRSALDIAENALEDAMESALDTECGEDEGIGPGWLGSGIGDGDDSDGTDDSDSEVGKSSDDVTGKEAAHDDSSTRNTVPDNFSGLDVDVAGTSLAAANVPFQVVSLIAGRCLYIPAGWYHCVWSESAESSCHMALNYWFHPPDKSPWDGTGSPYQSQYWTVDWSERGLDEYV